MIIITLIKEKWWIFWRIWKNKIGMPKHANTPVVQRYVEINYFM